MPQGPGTYGSKVGRPKKKKMKGGGDVRMGGKKESHMMPDGSMMRNDDPSMDYAHGGEVRMADVRFNSKRGKTY
jgi:hypothetical protein